MNLLDDYKRLVLEQQGQVDKYTEEAYFGIRDKLMTRGHRSIARAFGRGGWLPCDLADPYDSFEEMHADALKARGDGRPFLVSDVNHNGAMLSDATNLLFRAHHDAMHVLYTYGFSVYDEAHVCVYTCDDLALDARECAVMAAEIIGQGLYFDEHKAFPTTSLGLVGRQPIAPATDELEDWARCAFAKICRMLPVGLEVSK